MSIDIESTQLLSMADLVDYISSIPNGVGKNRVFNPADDPKFATTVDAPYELMYHSHQLGLTFLTLGPQYNATKSELKKARNVMRRAGIPPPSLDTPRYPLLDTMILELTSNIHEGFVCAVRYFGHQSKFNRWEDDTKSLPGLVKCLKRACKQIAEMIETDCKWVKTVIFQTDSEGIMGTVTKFWDWFDNSFPDEASTGVSERDYFLLNHNIERLEAVNDGIDVLFWKLPREYLPGAWYQTETDLCIVFPGDATMSSGSCGPCTSRHQLAELKFACHGNPGAGDYKLVEKYGHLKVGDSFPLFNNAGLDLKVTMKVDGSVAGEAQKVVDTKALQSKDGNVTSRTTVRICGH